MTNTKTLISHLAQKKWHYRNKSQDQRPYRSLHYTTLSHFCYVPFFSECRACDLAISVTELCFKWRQPGAHCFLVYLFQLLYMFRATVCPSSEELTESMRQWYFSFCTGGCMICRQDSPPIHSEKYHCRIDTVSSPDDGHVVARNM